MGDQDKINPILRGLLVDQIPNSPHLHQKNYMTDSKENY